MTESEAREFLQSIGYVPGQNNTREPRFDAQRAPRAERKAVEELRAKVKLACRVLFEAECARASLPPAA